jgi:hypothetical protein
MYRSEHVPVSNVTQADEICDAVLPQSFKTHIALSRLVYTAYAFLHYENRTLESTFGDVAKFRSFSEYTALASSLEGILLAQNPFGTNLTAIGTDCANCNDWTSDQDGDSMLVGYSKTRQYVESCVLRQNTTFLCAAIVESDPFTPSPTYPPD